jgi:subtilase family serine protease
LTLTIALVIRDPSGLVNFSRQVADPHSPLYRKYVSPERFADWFGATPSEYETLLNWARSNRLAVTAHRNRVVATVAGSVADIENALAVRFFYRRRPDGTRFFAPDVEPSLALALPVEHIGGLENFAMPAKGNASGKKDGYWEADYRHAYVPTVTMTGAGQKIGIFMLDVLLRAT